MSPEERFRALAETAAHLMEMVDTSARYGQPVDHAHKSAARKRLNAVLHPDYHVDRYGGLSEGMPYVNDAAEEAS